MTEGIHEKDSPALTHHIERIGGFLWKVLLLIRGQIPGFRDETNLLQLREPTDLGNDRRIIQVDGFICPWVTEAGAFAPDPPQPRLGSVEAPHSSRTGAPRVSGP